MKPMTNPSLFPYYPMTAQWLLYEYVIMLIRLHIAFYNDLLWQIYDPCMTLPWLFHRYAMTVPKLMRECYITRDCVMNSSMAVSWHFHDCSMSMTWQFQDEIMCNVSLLHDHAMTIPGKQRLLHDNSTAASTLFWLFPAVQDGHDSWLHSAEYSTMKGYEILLKVIKTY